MNLGMRNVLMWAVIAVVLLTVFNKLGSGNQDRALYTQLSNAYDAALPKMGTSDPSVTTIKEVEKSPSGSTVYYLSDDIGKRYGFFIKNGDSHALATIAPRFAPSTSDVLMKNGVTVMSMSPPAPKQSMLSTIVFSFGPILILLGVWIFFMRKMQGGGAGGSGAQSFGKSKAKLLGEDQIGVTFDDVAGCDEGKADLQDPVEFLKDPGKFQKLGGKIPTGLLMVGPPGTGKTLLARAVAGEAKVPFFTISGSDFVEMFVGVGASRVRDMFETAKKHAPCIIFIDEIDAVGRQRGAGLGGGHDEREQTLNQLLVEMDGFAENPGVIVIAATNRPDVLDKALLRPGRFDRQVVIGNPDVKGREAILKVHMRKKPIKEGDETKIATAIARGTPGFSGADLANIANEAALLAARNNKDAIDILDFESAKDKIMMGAERKGMVMTWLERALTAYHEAGHAIVGRLMKMKGHDPVYKVSIIPRGRALGVTMFLPERDQFSVSKEKLEAMISGLYGGRIAEEIIFGKEKVTTGASNDIERASDLAEDMVKKWGLFPGRNRDNTRDTAPRCYTKDDGGQPFLGKTAAQQKAVSGQTIHSLDERIESVLHENYAEARKVLDNNLDILHTMSYALLKYETIDLAMIDELMDGVKFEDLTPVMGWTEEQETAYQENLPEMEETMKYIEKLTKKAASENNAK